MTGTKHNSWLVTERASQFCHLPRDTEKKLDGRRKIDNGWYRYLTIYIIWLKITAKSRGRRAPAAAHHGSASGLQRSTHPSLFYYPPSLPFYLWSFHANYFRQGIDLIGVAIFNAVHNRRQDSLRASFHFNSALSCDPPLCRGLEYTFHSCQVIGYPCFGIS